MPGISVPKIPIPFPGGGGTDWAAFWASMISATVENAAPTHVVLTFPAAAALVAADFTIAGFTISSASWTGAVLTLVLSEAVLIFDGDLTITFVTTGGTATVINNVADDGATVAWYDSTDLTTLTKATGTTEAVSRWNDKLGSGNDLIQATGIKQPIWSADGVLGDGSNDMMKTAPFAYEQPETVYMVVKIFDTNITSKGLMDGNAAGSGLVYNINNSPSILTAYAGADVPGNEIISDDFFILRVIFDGALSKIQNNYLSPKAGNASTNDMGGITLFAWGNDSLWGKAQVKEAIFRNVSDGAVVQQQIYDYLADKYGLPVIPKFDNGKLIINFDDGGSSQYLAFEDLVAQGEKATFYLISNIIGTGANLSWAQVQAMNAGGMDIQCHTYDHPSLITLTEAQVYAEYDDLDAQFVAHGIPAAHHTAYPYGGADANVLTWTATRRLTGRMVAEGYVYPYSNKMALWTYSASSVTDFDVLKAAMLVAQLTKCAIMVYSHGIDGATWPRAKFNEVIDYAQSIGMDIITVSELYALM
jgi:peptidoglycan/xylan/chitin deacetylase (PgdA/CDA1 family)